MWDSKYHQRPFPRYAEPRTRPRSLSAVRRSILHPTRLATAAIVLLIFLFYNFGGYGDRIGHSRDISPYRSPAGKPKFSGLSDKKNGRVAIVTFTTEQKSYTHLSLKNHAYYAKKHGYDLIVDFEQYNPIGAMWHKFVMIEEALKTGQYDWVWWMDFDTLITNTTTTVQEVVHETLANRTNADDVDFILTPDCFELNAGSFLTRGHERSIKFFDRVREYHAANATQEHQLSEQDCMRDVIYKLDGSFTKHVAFVPQYKLNAFPDEIPCYDQTKRKWEKGTFAIHFAGAWAHVHTSDPAGDLMRKYSSEIIW